MQQNLEEKMKEVCRTCEHLVDEDKCELYEDKYGCPKLNEVLRDYYLHQGVNYGRIL